MPGIEIEREIGGVVYHCAKLPAEQALELFLRATKTLNAAEGLLESVILGSTNIELIRQFFAFVRDIDEAKVHALVVELSKLPKGDEPPTDLLALLQVACFALEVNFKDFLSERLGEALQQASPEPAEPPSQPEI